MILWAASLASAAPGCSPDLEPPCGPASRAGAEAFEVVLEPAAPLDRAPPVVRLLLSATEPIDPARVLVVEGEMSPSQLRQLERDDVSQALRERAVEVRVWSDGDGRTVVAPTVELEAGRLYTVASGEPAGKRELVIDEVPREVAHLVWPPEGEGAGRRIAVWCRDEPLPPLRAEAVLDPSGEAGNLLRGAVGALGERCVRFEGQPPPASDPQLAPPAIELGAGDPIPLEPVPLVLGEADPLPPSLSCEAGEIGVGPGCAYVADDRLWLRAPAAPLLWVLATDQVELVQALGPGEELLLWPLPPASQVPLEMGLLHRDGSTELASLVLSTQTPMPHLVITEVLANPVGEEPQQEWVELVNDGLAPAALGGYVLMDVGGETALPAQTLAPGQIALVVNEDYDEQSDYDAQPAPGTLILRVPSLGKHGLSNQGEPLKLVAGSGQVVSRFPIEPKPKAGESVQRLHPQALDGMPSSFFRGAPSPGAPNTPPAE